jgi:Tfp pilus assembly protein PilF
MTQISTDSAVTHHTSLGASRRRRVTALGLMPVLLVVGLAASACSSTPSSSPAKTADNLVTQGLGAESKGESQTAVNDFTAAIAANPTDTYAYYDLGVMYQSQLNNPTQAATEYNKAMLANPSYKPAIFNLAILETPTDPAGAIALYNKILALDPNDADTNFNQGLLLIAQNQSTQGHADLEKAIMLEPSLASRVPKGITP